MEVLVSDLNAAGTETTTSTIRWILFYLIRHPEIQKKVHREIERVVGKFHAKKIQWQTELQNFNSHAKS